MESDHLRISTSQVYLISTLIIVANAFLISIPSLVLFLPACIIFLILPGHLFVSLIFPKADELSDFLGIPGVWAIPVISISFISLTGFVLATIGFLSPSYITTVFALVAAAGIISGVTNVDFSVNKSTLRKLISQIQDSFGDKSVFSAIFLTSLLLGAVTVFLEVRDSEEPWLELYVTGTDGKIDSIPYNRSVTEPIDLRIEIVNHGFEDDFTIRKTVEKINMGIVLWENLTISEEDFQAGVLLITDNLNFSENGQYLTKYEIYNSGKSNPINSLQIISNISE